MLILFHVNASPQHTHYDACVCLRKANTRKPDEPHNVRYLRKVSEKFSSLSSIQQIHRLKYVDVLDAHPIAIASATVAC